MPIRQLLYTSFARPGVGAAELREITLASMRNNARAGVRGRLFFTGRGFCQLLEGSDAAVDAIMARIEGSPLHYDVCRILDRSIDYFTAYGWGMTPELCDHADALRRTMSSACVGVPAEAQERAINHLSIGGFGRVSFFEPDNPRAARLIENFEDWVRHQRYPCVGAKSAIARRQLTAYVGRSLASAWDDVGIVSELVRFAHDYAVERTMFQTFVAFFPDTPLLDEEGFEAALWDRLTSLQHKDVFLGQVADPTVSDDPKDPTFSLSFGGQSFFVVGLHPMASRPARKFAVAALVFNLHDQFVRLRQDGRYEGLRETILHRDEQLAGSRNPMLARHGEMSEARQYSGRMVGPDWECPYPGRDMEGER